MLCSRRVMAFLSLKTDFLERMATWHGLTSWRGYTGHSLEEGGLSPKVQWPQEPACPCAVVHPLCNPATQEAVIPPRPKGGTPCS